MDTNTHAVIINRKTGTRTPMRVVWTADMDTKDATEECAYCAHDVPIEDNPSFYDDDAWTALARHHAKDCEWVLTRAHRQDMPDTAA